MTNRILSKLALAAALLSSVPAVASAHDRDGAPPAGWAEPAPYARPGAYPPYAEPPRSDAREWRWRRDWREARWRERERAEVAAQLRALDAERDRFYAENGWRPGRARRFERYYAARRAELEQRWRELSFVAWR